MSSRSPANPIDPCVAGVLPETGVCLPPHYTDGVAPWAAAAHPGQTAGEAVIRVKGRGALGSPFLRLRAVLRARRAGDPELGHGSRYSRRT
ncbi:hypothetical protein NDU88_005717 [Pleurodeles waltl]|uniref:Uncharacterized protein n=1 Tax=Pleurodeles waltl TaxID=8319 RepID=A0AAV7WBG0_PLEWA|nr:hypothetical protein NDU88_005717 [Pleurodeles waltl]